MSKLAKILLCCFVVCLGSVLVRVKSAETNGTFASFNLGLPFTPFLIPIETLEFGELASFHSGSISDVVLLRTNPKITHSVIKAIPIGVIDASVWIIQDDSVHINLNLIYLSCGIPASGFCSERIPLMLGQGLEVLVINYGKLTLGERYRSHGTILRFSNDLSRRI